MPFRYDYSCSVCGWRGERVAALAERDALRCDNPVEAASEVGLGLKGTGFLRTDGTSSVRVPCGAQLVRDDGVALTAKMSHRWQP